jgi:hypothetical protein
MCVSVYLRFLFGLVGGAFGGNRGVSPVPPEKGVFPLDHMHLCDRVRVYSVNEQMYILEVVFFVVEVPQKLYMLEWVCHDVLL